jgi:hypothetical protein
LRLSDVCNAAVPGVASILPELRRPRDADHAYRRLLCDHRSQVERMIHLDQRLERLGLGFEEPWGVNEFFFALSGIPCIDVVTSVPNRRATVPDIIRAAVEAGFLSNPFGTDPLYVKLLY